MTPHLHPRSRLTSSLFGTTLLVSFLVVGMPHIFPCPAPRIKYADSEFEVIEDGRQRRRRRPPPTINNAEQLPTAGAISGTSLSEAEQENMRKKSHECPVPKPKGIVGQVLGFKNGKA
ncbi:hypothetical protein MMC21_005305 [Puttea exsequens]|nr:hypothetical protein [Puttea exsequens]